VLLDGASLASLEATCRYFGDAEHELAAGAGAGAGRRVSLCEAAAALACRKRGLRQRSLWCQASRCSWKRALHRCDSRARSQRRTPIPIEGIGLRGPTSPCFAPDGTLWVAEYEGRSVAQVAWDPSGGAQQLGALAVVRRLELPPSAQGLTATGVAASPDGLLLAVTVQSHFTEPSEHEHGVHVLDARTGEEKLRVTGREAGSNVDGGDGFSFPSGVAWLGGGGGSGGGSGGGAGRGAGRGEEALAIADYNHGRVQLRNAKTGELLHMIRPSGRDQLLMSSVAEVHPDPSMIAMC